MGHPSAFNSNQAQSDQQLQLVVHAGPLAGKGFPIKGDTLTIGRDPDNDISLDDEQVSRHHARLLRQEDQIIIEDFGSTNGTLVNGKPIVGQKVLQPADIISIGSSVFGVKGFAAPRTMGMTQLSSEPPPFPPPVQAPPVSPTPAPVSPPPASRRSAEPSKVTLVAVGGALALIVTIIIIAAFTGDDGKAPKGKTRVARLHLQIAGAEPPALEIKLMTAAKPGGIRIDAIASIVLVDAPR